MNSMFLTDGYKLDHRRQYPEGTEFVYSNLTARSAKHFSLPDGKVLDDHVVFGIRYLCEKYLIKEFNKNFFGMDEDVAALTYRKMLSYYLGKEASKNIGDTHIRSLHRLGYLPVEIRALPEGMICPIGVPCMTIINTKPEFYWVTNFLETLISSVLWMPMTSATTAREFKKELKRHCEKTGIDMNDFLVHDFSMRGMPGVEGAVLSGMGHLTVFSGSESIPAIVEIEKYYNKGIEVQTAGTIAATEHSVACANTVYEEDGSVSDEEYLDHILEVYPSGFVSTVADTYDFWRFITKYVADRKDKIMNRDGRLVIRPDSGIPEDIIAGDPNAKPGTVEYKGAYEILWEIFGGTVNKNGYKVLDSHIGMIYGDSITMERQAEIYRRLEVKGFSASNLVLGVGSWTYQGHATRDSLGFAVKATWARINGKPKELFKDPKTVVGMPKKSLRGFIQVHEEDGKIVAHDRQEFYKGGLLEPVFINGKTIGNVTLKEIRERINSSL